MGISDDRQLLCDRRSDRRRFHRRGRAGGRQRMEIGELYSMGAPTSTGAAVGGSIGVDESNSGSLSDVYWDIDNAAASPISVRELGISPTTPASPERRRHSCKRVFRRDRSLHLGRKCEHQWRPALFDRQSSTIDAIGNISPFAYAKLNDPQYNGAVQRRQAAVLVAVIRDVGWCSK